MAKDIGENQRALLELSSLREADENVLERLHICRRIVDRTSARSAMALEIQSIT